MSVNPLPPPRADPAVPGVTLPIPGHTSVWLAVLL